jgi:hypothetical protein
MQVQNLGQEDLLEKQMATYSSILVWRISWTEEPGGLQSIGSLGVKHDWSDLAHMHSINIDCHSILQSRKTGSQTGAIISQDHTASKTQCWDSNWSPKDLKIWAFFFFLTRACTLTNTHIWAVMAKGKNMRSLEITWDWEAVNWDPSWL